MPPRLAAGLFVIFIVWLFRRYSKESGPIPRSLWIPFIWVGINSSRPLIYWFADGDTAAGAADVADGNFIDRNVYLALIIIGIVVLVRRRIQWNRALQDCRWLILLYAYFLISTLWSEYPYIAFKRWFKDVGDIVMILIILTEQDPVEAIRAVFVRCFYLLVPLSVLFIKYYPALGRYTHRWTYKTYYSGITGNKNSLGLLAMLGGLFLLWQIVEVYKHRGKRLTIRNLWPDLLVLLMCIWLLRLAGSATAVACFLLGTAALFLARSAWVKSNLRSFGWGAFGLAGLMLVFTISPGLRELIAGALGRDVTLTDRTLIWDLALKSGSNPILGSGFNSFWMTSKAEPIQEEFHVSIAHNGYLETYLHTGWIGVLLLAGVLATAGRNAVSQYYRSPIAGRLFMVLLLVGLFYNYTEVAFSRANALGLILWLLAAYGPNTSALAAQEPHPPLAHADFGEGERPAPMDGGRV